MTSRPSSSSQPIAPWVSSCACVTRCVRQVPRDGDRARRERGVDVAADAVVERRDDVAGGLGHPVRGGPVGVQHRCARAPGLLGIEDRGEDVVLDGEQAAGLLGGRGRLGDHGGHPLPDEAHDVVEHAGVVGVVLAVLVPGGRVTVAPGRPRA